MKRMKVKSAQADEREGEDLAEDVAGEDAHELTLKLV